MLLKICFLMILMKLIESMSIESEELNLFTMKDYVDMEPRLKKAVNNIREKFLSEKRQKTALKNIEKIIANNTIYVDGIPHSEITQDWKRVLEIEDDYKKLITMRDFKYVYKRDAHWRTWRQIRDTNGKKKIICYKCQSTMLPNCTECANSGVWIIEEGMPPCPYELFFVVNSNELCASNYTQLAGKLKACPSRIKYADLTKTCNNPIMTRWRFTQVYNISKRPVTSVICDGRDFCEISTLYQIRPEYVIFRIINASDTIIYSRIMRNNRKNYACINNCGAIDLNTFKVTKNDDSRATILDLLPKKSKRDSVKNNKLVGRTKLYLNSSLQSNYKEITSVSGRISNSNKKGRRRGLHSKRKRHKNIKRPENITYKWIHTGRGYFMQAITTAATTTKSHCKKMIADAYHEDSYEEDSERVAGRPTQLYLLNRV